MGCACSRRVKDGKDIPDYEDDEGESAVNVRNLGGTVAAGAVMGRGPRSVAPHPGLVLDSTGGNVGSGRSDTACKLEAALLKIELEISGLRNCSLAGTRHETSRTSLRPRRNKITPSKIKEIKRRVALLVSELPKMDHHQQQGSPILPKQMEAAVDRACMGDLGALRSLLRPDATSRWPPNRATAPEIKSPDYDDDSEAVVRDGLGDDSHTVAAAAAAAAAELASQIVPSRAFRASAARVAPAEERREEPAHRQHEVWKAAATTLTTIAEDSKDASDVDSCETTKAVRREISPMELYRDNYDSQFLTTGSSQTPSLLRMPPRLSAAVVGTTPSARILREEGPAAARRGGTRRGAHSEGNDDPGSVSSAVTLAPALGSGDSQACQGKNVAPEGKGEISKKKKSRRASKASGSYASRDNGYLKMPEPSSAPLPYRSSRYRPVRSSPNDDPPRVPPTLQTQPLPSQEQQQKLRRLNHSPITCKSPASSTVDPKDDWAQPLFEDVHVQPVAAPNSPHIEQSSGSSASPYSSDSPPPTVARPEAAPPRDDLGAKAGASTVEGDPSAGAAAADASVDESWKKALSWRSQTPAPSTVLKRSALPQLRARSRPSVQPVPTTLAMPKETSRELLPPTSPPGQEMAKSSAGATSALGVKPGGLVRPSSRTAVLAEATISPNGDDSELCLPTQSGEETEAPSTAEVVEMPEKSSSLLVASKVSASPGMAPETPRVDPSTSKTASNFAAPVAPETSVPLDSAIESPPYTSRSLHSVSSTSGRGGKTGVNSLGTPPDSGPSPAAVCLDETESTAKTMEAAAIATAITEDPASVTVTTAEDMLIEPAASGKFGADGVATPRSTRPSSTKTAFPELSMSSRRQKARWSSKASALKGSSAGESRRSGRRSKTDEEDDVMAALSAAAAAHRVRTTERQGNPRRRVGGVADNVVIDAGVGEGLILSSSTPAVASRVIDADTPVAEVKEAYDCSLQAPSHESEASYSMRKPAVREAFIAMPLGGARSPMPAAAATPKREDTAEMSVPFAAAASTLPRDTELDFGTFILSDDTYATSRVSTNATASDFLDGATEHSFAAADAAHASLRGTAARGSEIGLEEPCTRIGGRGPQAFASTESRDIGDGFGDNDSLTSEKREGFGRFVEEEELAGSLSEVETGVLPEGGEVMVIVSMEEAQPEPQPETRNLTTEDLGGGGGGGRYTIQTPPPFSREVQTPPPFSREVQTPPPFSGGGQRPLPFSGEMQTPPPFHDEIFQAVDAFDRGDGFDDVGGPACSSQASEETDEEGGEVTFPPSPPPGCSDNCSAYGEAEEEFYRIDPAGNGDAGGALLGGSSPCSSLAPAAEEGGCVGTVVRDAAVEPTAAVAGEGWGAGWDQQKSLAREAVRVERRAVGDVGGEHQAVAEAFGSNCIEGVRLVVEWLGSVESVVRAMAVSKAWRDAVRPDADRLYKVIVRRAGVTPRRRAAFWEYLVLHRPPRPRQQAGDSTDPLRSLCTLSSSPSSSLSTASRLSLTELANRGMKSRWSKAIDADVARTFGRPNSRRQSFRMGAGQDIRQRHWWPESLGGAPLGARTPMGSSSTGNCNYGAPNNEEAFQDLPMAGVEGCDDLEAARVAAAAGAALAVAAFRCSRSKESAADGSGGEGGKETAAGGTSFSTFSTAAISSSGNWSVGEPRSSSPLSCRVYSTLSPLGTPLRGQEGEDYAHGGCVGGEGEGEEGDGSEFVPSPRILRELEAVRGQLTDALRALAVAFSKVGYCQGLDYVVAHIIKCLGTDANRAYSSDPDRVFTVLIGLFEGYGLQHIYSEELETLQTMLGVLDLLIEEHLPRLHRHFQQQEVDVAYFAVGWFQTLFLYTTRMPPDTLLWLWDVWVMERSYKVFFRAALAILALLESRLLALDLEAIMAHLGHFPNGSAAAMEKDALVPAALSFKVTDSILRDKQRQLDLSKKRGANSLGWTPRRPPESHASPISPCDDYFPTEEEGVTVSASSASPVDAGTGNVEGDFVGSPNARQGKQLSSNCASDDGGEVNVRKARGVPSAGGCRGTDGSYIAGAGAGGSRDISPDGDQEFATMTRLVYCRRRVDGTVSKCQGAKRVERSPCGEKRGTTRSPSDSRQPTTPTLPDHGPGKTAVDPSGVTDFSVRFEPEAEPTTRPRETLPLSPRSLAGVAASRDVPVHGTVCKADAEANAGEPSRRASGSPESDQDSEGSLPPEIEPLARAGRTGGFVPSSRSHDWSLAKILSSGSSAAGGSEGRSRGVRFDSAPAAAPLPPGVLPPGVLPPGVQPPGVCPPGKLGGKDEYALFAAGNE